MHTTGQAGRTLCHSAQGTQSKHTCHNCCKHLDHDDVTQAQKDEGHIKYPCLAVLQAMVKMVYLQSALAPHASNLSINGTQSCRVATGFYAYKLLTQINTPSCTAYP